MLNPDEILNIMRFMNNQDIINLCKTNISYSNTCFTNKSYICKLFLGNMNFKSINYTDNVCQLFKFFYKYDKYYKNDDYDIKNVIEFIIDKENYTALEFLLRNTENKDNLALKISSEKGNLNFVKYLIEGFNVDNNVALLNSVRFEQINIINYLLENNTNVNFHEDDLIEYVFNYNDNIEIMKILLRYSDDNNRNIALFYCSDFGNLEIVKFLIEDLGVDINIEHDRTLINSIKAEHLDIIEYLVNNGANIHQQMFNMSSNSEIEEYLRDNLEINANLYNI